MARILISTPFDFVESSPNDPRCSLSEARIPKHIIVGVSGVSRCFSVGRKRASLMIQELFQPAIVAGEGLDVILDADKAFEIYDNNRKSETIKITKNGK